MKDKPKQYEVPDYQFNVKIEKKHLYFDIVNLNKYYYQCYCNVNQVFRSSYGNIILEKISKMLTGISEIYFSSYNKEKIYNLFLLLKDIEFHIRLCNELHIFSKKQILNMSRFQAELLNHLKTFMEEDELCKQS